ncbi:hypothetical protein [Pseudomonas fluorescens]|uniref:hypothetical protein n=1 Tax=Pseudomonas fluorescens TaxID=294 RepID=UPI0002DD5975|nr:hypothetical protein [Pseudomonas fluorescens]
MNSLQAKPVYLVAASVFNSAGSECADLHGSAPVAHVLDFPPGPLAYPVTVPRLPTTVFDRKIQRNVEPQGARLLYCAGRMAGPLNNLHLAGERVALMAAIPEVDGPSSCWEAVQAIAEQPDALLTQLFAHTPPLHALMMLNSSVMAYVAEALHCHGPMGGFCSQSNAGIDALIEAVEQIAGDRADAGVVVSSSPNLSPALYLRDSTQSPPQADASLYGEGAAALLLTSRPPANGTHALRIAGFARGYSASPERSSAVAQRVVQQTLAREKLGMRDVARIVAAPGTPFLPLLFADTQAIFHSSRHMTGDLGASALLTEIALALHDHADGYTLLLDHSRAGHWGAVLLANETTEKQA